MAPKIVKKPAARILKKPAAAISSVEQNRVTVIHTASGAVGGWDSELSDKHPELAEQMRNAVVAVGHVPALIPRTVATVDVPRNITSLIGKLEYAFRWTNNTGGSWSNKEEALEDEDGEMVPNHDFNPRVTVEVPLHTDGPTGLRSTSIGDHMLIGNTRYRAAAIGFETLDGKPV